MAGGIGHHAKGSALDVHGHIRKMLFCSRVYYVAHDVGVGG